MKKIFLSFLLVMAGISHTLAQGLDGNVEQRLKDFFTRYETSYANIGKCKLDRYEVNHDKKRLNVYASPSFGYQPFTPEKTEAIYGACPPDKMTPTLMAGILTASPSTN